MSKAINVLIVEDEYLTADTIKSYLEEFDYKVSGMARDAHEAMNILDKGKTDIAILDMNIQGSRDGIWLAEMINANYQIPFIFLTAYSDTQTVKSAVKTKPYGYVVKPFEKMDVFTALEVAIEKFNQIKEQPDQPNITFSTEEKVKLKDHIFVKDRNGYGKIVLNDILYIKSELKYLEIYIHGKKYVLRYSLKDMMKLLPREDFIQVHRSYVVNKKSVEYIGGNYIKILDTEIPISHQRKNEIIGAFNFL